MTNESVYITPPESPVKFPTRERTPYPHNRRSSMRNDTLSYFTNGKRQKTVPETMDNWCHDFETRKQSILSAKGLASVKVLDYHPNRLHTLPVQPSSESLDRYRPMATAIPPTSFVAAEAGSIIEKIKRQKQSMARVNERVDKSTEGSKRNGDAVGSDARSDLKKELEILFRKD
jgi:hypothetical protein